MLPKEFQLCREVRVVAIDFMSQPWYLRFGRCCVGVNDLVPVSQYFVQGSSLKFVTTYRDMGVLIDFSFCFQQHIHATARKDGGTRWVGHWPIASWPIACWLPAFMVSLFVAHVCPLLDYVSCVQNSGHWGDSHSGQRRSWS